MIELSFTPNARDYGRAQLYVQRHLLGVWYWAFVLGLCVSLGCAAFGFMMMFGLAYDLDRPETAAIAKWSIGLFFLGTYAALFLRTLVRRSMNKTLYRAGGFFSSERTMIFDENGVISRAPLTEMKFAWTDVIELIRTQHNIFLRLDPGFVLFIPCRIASAPEELERLWDQLHSWHHTANKK